MRRKHYSNGGLGQTREAATARFWSMVDRHGEDECWPWRGALWTGYGFFMSKVLIGGRTTAHRVAYMLTYGEFPASLDVDHKCRNRACCNPKHLEPVTMAVNVLRGDGITARRARATQCIRGHEYTPENTKRVVIRGRPSRQCRACIRAYDKARSQKSRTNSQRVEP